MIQEATSNIARRVQFLVPHKSIPEVIYIAMVINNPKDQATICGFFLQSGSPPHRSIDS